MEQESVWTRLNHFLGFDQVSDASRLMLASAATSVALLAGVSAIPAPYAVLSPGPATNTLGTSDGTPLITITGHETYPTSGALDLTTVRVQGGGSTVDLFTMVHGWLDKGVAVYPEERIFPKGQSAEQNEEENHLEMATSQQSATAAALRVLGYKVIERMQVASFGDKSPAEGELKVGDKFVAVNGVPVNNGDDLRAELQKITPGQVAPMAVERDGKQISVKPGTKKGSKGETLLGILVQPAFDYPFEVTINIENVGGPSAGTMFALGIIDKLTPGELTGGRTIAGTGTITPDGEVGPIGGIREKLIGARKAGATVFLAPADNCDEVVGRVPEGMSVIKISTLTQARDALEKLNAKTPIEQLPTCS